MRDTCEREAKAGGEVAMPPAFLRFDRPELEHTTLVIRATPAPVRAQRRRSAAVPLGYLYEQTFGCEPQFDEEIAAGHYDRANQIWVFSGDVTGIGGITEPLSPLTPDGSASTPHVPTDREKETHHEHDAHPQPAADVAGDVPHARRHP